MIMFLMILSFHLFNTEKGVIVLDNSEISCDEIPSNEADWAKTGLCWPSFKTALYHLISYHIQ